MSSLTESSKRRACAAPVMMEELALGLRLLHAAPFRDEQRGCLGGFAQRLQIDIFVEAMHRRSAGAEAKARDVVVEPIEACVCQCREHEVLDGAAIDRVERLAEG